MDTLRLLGQAQDDITASDVSTLFSNYLGPPEVAELMLSIDSARYEILQREDDSTFYPPLAAALRIYGTGVKTWESFIRLLLRSGNVDLHAQVPRRYHSDREYSELASQYPCVKSGPVTPLDELFMWTDSPNEGALVALDWLQMLADEGYNVLAYLKTEQALHDIQWGFTLPSQELIYHDAPRKFVFDLGPNSSVGWEWWVDPNLPAALVRQEFRDINLFTCDWRLPSESWDECWPFIYPDWSIEQVPHNDEEFPDWERRYKRANLRAERRLKKKSNKLARIHGTYKPNQVPGAWPV